MQYFKKQKIILFGLIFCMATAPVALAGNKISELPAATTITGTEQLPITQSGVTKSATTSLLRGYFTNLLGAGGVGFGEANTINSDNNNFLWDNSAKRLAINCQGVSPSEALTICSPNTPGIVSRIYMDTYETTSGIDASEQIRLAWKAPSAKTAIAFGDGQTGSYLSKVWVQAHEKLQYYTPISMPSTAVDTSADTFTFAGSGHATGFPVSVSSTVGNPAPFKQPITFLPAAINTGTGVINLPAHGLVTGDRVMFSSTTNLFSPMSPAVEYFVRAVDANNITPHKTSAGASGNTLRYTLTSQGSGVHTIHPIYNERIIGSAIPLFASKANALANTSRIDITTQGTGTHTITPMLEGNNNQHQHFSIEVADSTGAKQSRLSIPYGFDTTQIGTFSADLNVNEGKFRVLGDETSFKEVQFGNTASDNLRPDGTNLRWSIRQDNTTESGSNAGSDLRIVTYDDMGQSASTRALMRRDTGFLGLGGVTAAQVSDILTIAPGSIRKIIVAPATSGAGNRLNLESGAAATGATDSAGGELRLLAGNSTGTGSSFLSFYTATSGTTGTTARTASEKVRIDGDGDLAIGLTVPTSRLHVTGSAAFSVATVSANTTLDITHNTVRVDATGAARTITLPDASTCVGRLYRITKIDASGNAVTVATTASQTIDGASTVSLATQWTDAVLQSDGSNWLRF